MARPNRAGRPEDHNERLAQLSSLPRGCRLVPPQPRSRHSAGLAMAPFVDAAVSCSRRCRARHCILRSTHQRALVGPCNPAPTGSPGAAGRGCGRTQTQRYRMDVRHAALEWQSAPSSPAAIAAGRRRCTSRVHRAGTAPRASRGGLSHNDCTLPVICTVQPCLHDSSAGAKTCGHFRSPVDRSVPAAPFGGNLDAALGGHTRSCWNGAASPFARYDRTLRQGRCSDLEQIAQPWPGELVC